MFRADSLVGAAVGWGVGWPGAQGEFGASGPGSVRGQRAGEPACRTEHRRREPAGRLTETCTVRPAAVLRGQFSTGIKGNPGSSKNLKKEPHTLMNSVVFCGLVCVTAAAQQGAVVPPSRALVCASLAAGDGEHLSPGLLAARSLHWVPVFLCYL